MSEPIWIDWIIIGVIGISALISLIRGFVREAISLAGWIAAAWLSLTFFESAAVHLAAYVSVPSARLAVAFAGLFIATMLLTGLTASLAGMVVDKTGLTGTDRVLGMLFGAGRGVVIMALLVLAAGFTPLPQDPWWNESQLIAHFERLAVTIRDALPPEVSTQLQFK